MTNLNFRYKYQLFIHGPFLLGWGCVKHWKSAYVSLFLSHKGIYVEGTEWHSRDRGQGGTVQFSPSPASQPAMLVSSCLHYPKKNRAINKVGLWELSDGRWPTLYHLISTVYNSSHVTADSDGKVKTSAVALTIPAVLHWAQILSRVSGYEERGTGTSHKPTPEAVTEWAVLTVKRLS